jgi:hypothetical protein
LKIALPFHNETLLSKAKQVKATTIVRNTISSSLLIGIFVSFIPAAAFAQLLDCEDRYAKIADYFYTYNEYSAKVNAEMDRIALRLQQDGVLEDINHVAPDLIKPSEAELWANAIKDFISLAQPMLQELLEFREFGCATDENSDQLEKMINTATDQLKLSRTRLNGLLTIY